jgi:hypothetical protein
VEFWAFQSGAQRVLASTVRFRGILFAVGVRCKGIGCGRNVPTPVEIRVQTGSIVVLCPVCLERRSYIVSTEVFMGSPSWEVMRVLQGRR